jgi:hypothetical protein
MLPFYLTTLGEIYGMAGQLDEGLKRLAEAAEMLERTQERWAEAETHRLRGTLLLDLLYPPPPGLRCTQCDNLRWECQLAGAVEPPTGGSSVHLPYSAEALGAPRTCHRTAPSASA